MKDKKGINRRSFLKGAGLVSAAAVTGCQKIKNSNKAIHNFLNQYEEVIVPYDVETWETTSCSLCPSFCGINVRKIGERVVKIEGNPLHPVNRGGICPRGVAGINHLYNPNRVKSPLRREGSGNSAKWIPISWNDALKELSDKLISQRNENPAGVMFLHSIRSSILEKRLYHHFMESYGSPNYIPFNDAYDWDDECQLDAIYLMQGILRKPSFDIKNSGIVLSFSNDYLESCENLMQSISSYGYARRERKEGRTKFIHFGTRLSSTAASADRWIPIKPGTEAIIALSIAYVLIREDLYDYNFVAKYCTGFEDEVSKDGKIRRGFKYWVMSGYAPVDVEEITGVSAEEIITVARELYSARPAIVIGRRDDIMTQMAVHSLNLLCGSIGSKGGMIFPHQIPLTQIPKVKKDEVSKASFENNDKSSSGAEGFNENNPASVISKFKDNANPVKLLLVKDANPVYSSPARDEWIEILKKIPYKVSFSSVMDETTSLCDLVLPDCTYLEKWGGAAVNTSEGYQVFSVSKPVVSPVVDCRATEDVILEVSSKMPVGISRNLQWKNLKEYLEWSIEGLFDAGRGDVISEEFKGRWVRLLEKAGWKVPKKITKQEFVKEVLEKGGWWDPIFYYNELPGIIDPKKGKVEFMPTSLKPQIEKIIGSKEKEVRTKYSRFIEGRVNPFYPDLISERISEKEGLYLHISKTISLTSLSQPNSPWLMDNATSVISDRWETWVEINPETAKKMNLKDGEYVIIESSKGRIRAIVSISEGIHPESIAIPAGLGHKGNGEWSSGIGSNAVDVMIEERDPLSGVLLPDRTMVKIYKA
ncbi:MAG: twin-arginine translocation signal domain-containing protein [Candidatus Schekmanbacteria bacterium]|nr:MAG: twin-arginine translocation signal domain-containing protein [Candidatus Schekmanbacteria bacterium]